MKTTCSPKTARRVGRGAPGIIAGLLVTALLGLVEPAENHRAAPATEATTLSPTTVAWKTSGSHGPHSRDDEHDDKNRDDSDDEKHDEDHHDKDHDDEKDHEKDDERGGRKDDDRDEKKDETNSAQTTQPDSEKRDGSEKKDGSEKDESGGVLPAVGQLSSESVGCGGTVIESKTRRLVLTAAQCVYTPRKDNSDLGSKEPGFISEELAFVPGRAGDDAPHGEWVVDGMWVPEGWMETGDPSDDVAVLTIAERDDKAIQDVVGAQEVDFSGGEQSGLTAVGYPAEAPFDGTTQKRCNERGNVALEDGLYSMSCVLTGGVGGASWFADLNKEGSGKIVAVTSGLSADGKRMVGTPLGDAARELIEAAEADTADRDKSKNEDNKDEGDEGNKNGGENNNDANNGGIGEIEI